MVEKQYGWLDKRDFVPLQRYTAQVVNYISDLNGSIKLLIKCVETSMLGEVELWKENRNKIIDVLGSDEKAWVGKHFAFAIETKSNGDKVQRLFHVLIK